MKSLRVPGTTIAVTLLPGFVEVRDKGLVKKKIPVRNRAFEEVLEDLEIFFHAHGKRLPPGVLSDTLVRIGVPRAKRIITQETYEPEKKVEQPEIIAPPLEVHSEVPKEPQIEITEKEEPIDVIARPPDVQLDKPQLLKPEPDVETEIDQSEHIDIKPGEILKISEKDLPDIEEALMTVEALSDSFMAAKENSPTPVAKPQIRISISGTEEIQASDASTASVPSQFVNGGHEDESIIESEDIEVPEIGDLSDGDRLHGNARLGPAGIVDRRPGSFPLRDRHLRQDGGSARQGRSASEPGLPSRGDSRHHLYRPLDS